MRTTTTRKIAAAMAGGASLIASFMLVGPTPEADAALLCNGGPETGYVLSCQAYSGKCFQQFVDADWCFEH